ncbi:DUF6371 domain-containing protein [Flavobacterium soyangense]|uniref:DUF6371 domain-containing protein n=1 Tax=Flavobacterium soyangense TaxID=2023265 RepID=UPI0037422FA2
MNESKKKGIAIVQSEKTALMMSLFLSNYIWMATGGKGNFNKKMLLPQKKSHYFGVP